MVGIGNGVGIDATASDASTSNETHAFDERDPAGP